MKTDTAVLWKENAFEVIYDVMDMYCRVCGYDKCTRALHFHHINSSLKKFNIAEIRRKCISWDDVIAELKKCCVLCSNCHAELHDGKINPILTASFNDLKYNEVAIKCENVDCNERVLYVRQRFCSQRCRKDNEKQNRSIAKNILNAKSVWANIDVIQLLAKNNGVMLNAAKEVGLSDNGVKKHFKRVTGCNNWKEYLSTQTQVDNTTNAYLVNIREFYDNIL